MQKRLSQSKQTRLAVLIAVLAAAYLVLSASMKIPMGGNIKLDLGYAALTVACVYLGAGPAAAVGIIGAFFESLLFTERGISPGWILMNAIVGYFCGMILSKLRTADKKRLILTACVCIPLIMLPAVAVKTAIDCLMYSLRLEAKIATGLIALAADSAVMLVFGIPLSIALKSRLR